MAKHINTIFERAPCIPDSKVRIYRFKGKWYAEVFVTTVHAPVGMRRHDTSPVAAWYSLRIACRASGSVYLRKAFNV